MQLNRRALKKRKGTLRPKIGITILGLVIISLAIGVYYFAGRAFLSPVYISPLSQAQALNIASQNEVSVGDVEKLLREKNIAYTSVAAYDGVVVITMAEGKKVLLSQKKDLSTQISSLQFILSRLTMEGRAFKSLDLRFDKPTIILEK